MRCNLLNVLRLGSQESAAVATAIDMGLLSVLERLARRAHEPNDAGLEKVLHVLRW